MKRFAVASLAAIAALALYAGCATSAEAQGDDGWVALFNGENLDGWEQKNGIAKYTVEDGAIVGTSVPNTPNSFLCTKKHYSDFILEFEFKGHPNLNSGCQIRSNSFPDYKDGRVHGYQCELEQDGRDRGYSGGIYDEGRRGWLYPRKSDEEFAKKFGEEGVRAWKAGEWNKVRIKCEGDHIQTWVNGVKRADLHDPVTGSGFIALQVHGVGDKAEPMSVRWRDIRIKELD